jgi:membrane dipeptidase
MTAKVDASEQVFGAYAYGLSEEEEERAARLHRDSIVCDMLFQGPCGYRSFGPDIETELETEFKQHNNHALYMGSSWLKNIEYALRGDCPDFELCWRGSGLTAANRQAPMSFTTLSARTWGLTIAQFDTFPWLVKALTAADIRRAKCENKVAGYLSNQFLGEMGSSIELLDAVHAIGMRMIQLTYNSMNLVGAGCTERTDAGISHFGARVIGRMNQLGIIVDTGHCGRQTTLDACALSAVPIVASHTSAAAVYKVDRAKSDEELRAIAGTGGVIGVYAVPFFLAPGEGVTIEAMLDHIDYMVTLVGWVHVGIGTDWPLSGSKEALRHFQIAAMGTGFREEHNLDCTTNLVGFDDYRDFPNITRGLVKRGYTDDQIRGILGENFVRVFEQVCG